MAGFIEITSEKWIDYLKSHKKDFAVFWCKKKSFKALKCGDDFYFLRRSGLKTNADRYIAGKGAFVEFKLMPVNMIWSEYGNCVGFEKEEDFIVNVKKYMVKELIIWGALFSIIFCSMTSQGL